MPFFPIIIKRDNKFVTPFRRSAIEHKKLGNRRKGPCRLISTSGGKVVSENRKTDRLLQDRNVIAQHAFGNSLVCTDKRYLAGRYHRAYIIYLFPTQAIRKVVIDKDNIRQHRLYKIQTITKRVGCLYFISQRDKERLHQVTQVLFIIYYQYLLWNHTTKLRGLLTYRKKDSKRWPRLYMSLYLLKVTPF